jgi:hypothetical protein
MQKIMLLALGDVFWTRFAHHLSQQTVKHDVKLTIVLESRSGEYQAYLKRINYPGAKVYYLTDFLAELRKIKNIDSYSARPMLCDYLRMSTLGQITALQKVDWGETANQLHAFANRVLEIETPNIILGDTVSTSLSWIFCAAAMQRNIAYWGLAGSRLPGRFCISNTIKDEDKAVEEKFIKISSGEEPMSDEERDWAESYIQGLDHVVPDYMKSPMLNSISLSKFLKTRYLKIIIGSLLYSLKERTDLLHIRIRATPISSFLNATKRNIGRVIKSRYIKRLYTPESRLDPKSKFFLYPLHYQPEASTLVGSPFYHDQLEVIRNICFSLPPGTKLYVKEHISNFGYPSLSFYRALTSLPNLIFIDHKADIKNLIRSSRAVITLTSTAGYEALLLNKHAYHFGDVFYTYHPNAIRITSWDALAQQLAEPPKLKAVCNLSFAVAYRRYTHEGSLNFMLDDFGITNFLFESFARDNLPH